jgi:hypothetical protein
MMGGPALMLFLAAIMIQRGGGWDAPASIAFVVVMFASIAARRLDPHNGYGELTAAGELRKHAIITIGIGVALWLIANALGDGVLGSIIE